MKEPNVKNLKKYLAGIEKIKAKYITAERLSKVVGIYPEVIAETFSYFDPMVKMDYDYNLLELVVKVKAYISSKEQPRTVSASKKEVHKKVTSEVKYKNVQEYIYKKLAIGGMFSLNTSLTDEDLKIMKHLITEQQTKNKHKRKR